MAVKIVLYPVVYDEEDENYRRARVDETPDQWSFYVQDEEDQTLTWFYDVDHRDQAVLLKDMLESMADVPGVGITVEDWSYVDERRLK